MSKLSLSLKFNYSYHSLFITFSTKFNVNSIEFNFQCKIYFYTEVGQDNFLKNYMLHEIFLVITVKRFLNVFFLKIPPQGYS